ncbi:MAG: ORF6N domain-containing protein [Deltaproteobacteria bacterium]|jgi:hypothetical protein|nr:ORF6N domain-containing protein [Deltaproteobacteria bacterium]
MSENLAVVTVKEIQTQIHTIREQKVLLDSDLATMYQVETRTLNQAVTRNIERFPEDFMFQLTEDEYKILRSQNVILRSEHGKHRKYTPRAFTENGVAMLSSVLRSTRAIQVNIEIMRTFTQLREAALTHVKLSRKLEQMETKYDQQFKVVFDALKALVTPPKTTKRKIGFTQND